MSLAMERITVDDIDVSYNWKLSSSIPGLLYTELDLKVNNHCKIQCSKVKSVHSTSSFHGIATCDLIARLRRRRVVKYCTQPQLANCALQWRIVQVRVSFSKCELELHFMAKTLVDLVQHTMQWRGVKDRAVVSKLSGNTKTVPRTEKQRLRNRVAGGFPSGFRDHVISQWAFITSKIRTFEFMWFLAFTTFEDKGMSSRPLSTDHGEQTWPLGELDYITRPVLLGNFGAPKFDQTSSYKLDTVETMDSLTFICSQPGPSPGLCFHLSQLLSSRLWDCGWQPRYAWTFF